MGVLLANRSQFDPALCQLVFDCIVVVGLVTDDHRALWHSRALPASEIEDLKAAGVACGTSAQEEFNGLAIFGDHHVNLQSIKVTPLGGGVASILLALIEFASSYPNVVTSSHREGVHDVDALLVQLLPHLSQYVEQAEKLVFDPLEATAKAALTQHPKES